MVKIGEEILENGQILEIFQEGSALIKKPKPEKIEVKQTIITRNQFNNLLGRDTIKNLLIAAKTDVDIETFKFFLSSCDKGIDLQDLNLIDGMNYLLYKGYVTQDIYNNIMN